MSATNSTPNYELPIFEATDKPTWQGDFNQAMNKIDTAVGDVEEKANTNSANISTVNQSIVTLNAGFNNLNGDVSQINTKLTNRVIVINNSNLVVPNSVSFIYTDASRNIYYNGNTLQMLCGYQIVNLNGSALIGTEARTPLIKVAQNLFGLETSTIGDNNNKYRLANVWAQSSNNSNFYLSGVHAYYDGENTIVYISTNQSWGTGFIFSVSVTTLNAGVIV